MDWGFLHAMALRAWAVVSCVVVSSSPTGGAAVIKGAQSGDLLGGQWPGPSLLG